VFKERSKTMTKDPNRDEQLILAKKMEEALRERTNQITVALQQSKKELAAAIAKREALEAQQ
jgi:hypothetical protein